MDHQAHQQTYWNSRATSWNHHSEPLIPNTDELLFQRQQLIPNGTTLVLGVTPQLCQLAQEISNSVTSVDFAQDLIDALSIMNVTYVCDEWEHFLEHTTTHYDNIITDGGFVCLSFPDDWRKMSDLIYKRLKPGGIFSTRTYLSTNMPPKTHYENPSLARLVPHIAKVDKRWMVRITGHPDYERFNVVYTFPPREVVIETFQAFTLKDEFTPSYEEGERFVTFTFQRPIDER